MTKENKPSVLLIYTGGTIGMIENPETSAQFILRKEEKKKKAKY